MNSIVRTNLLADINYRPYCGNNVGCYNPRTEYIPTEWQFICPNCKWRSSFPTDFIKQYKKKHNLK